MNVEIYYCGFASKTQKLILHNNIKLLIRKNKSRKIRFFDP